MGRIVQLVQHAPAPVGIRPRGSASSLLNGLRAYYKLDEVGGARADQVNGLTLTDNNTVGSAAGIISNAAQFVAASNEYLSRTSSPLLTATAGDSVGISFWTYLDTLPLTGFVGKWNNGIDQQYLVILLASMFRFYTSGTGLDQMFVEAALPSPALTNTWYHVLAWYDAIANTNNIRINGGLVYSDVGPSDVFGGLATADFTVGSYSGSSFADGRIDELGIWIRPSSSGFTTTEQDQLYNGGAGVTYPAFA